LSCTALRVVRFLLMLCMEVEAMQTEQERETAISRRRDSYDVSFSPRPNIPHFSLCLLMSFLDMP
jgi:hypothetical protein